MIKLGAVYVLAGLVFGAFAVLSATDRNNPKRFGNAAFWGLVATSFLAGDYLGDLGNGILVLGLALIAGFGFLGRGQPATTSPEARRALAERFGERLFIPALTLPVVVIFGVLVLKPLTVGGQPLIDPTQATLISLALAAVVGVVVGLVLLKQPLISPLQEGRRLMDTVGWAALLPQMLAALGAVFALAGVGTVIGDLVTAYIPMDTRLAAVAVYCLGMAGFTMIMGNAFAAFPVLTAGVGLPILIQRFGGDPAVVCSIGMLSGFCGTLMTPLAANFNLVPPALLELPDRYSVIKAQIPTAVPLLIANIGLMYVFAFLDRLTAEQASLFARLALGHVAREYPNKMDHVLTGPEDLRGPRDLHPIFFGSFDWHSCVHGYWTLASVLRRFPGIPELLAIRALFDGAFTPEKVAAEADYLARPSARGFERPYGWGWLLKLQAELLAHDAPWSATHQPLADAFARRFSDFLPMAGYPIRTGVHSSTAFAIALASDYARAAGDEALADLFRAKVRAWHLTDKDAQAWEPSGDDFLSPTLVAAECLRRLLPAGEFEAWLADYLPQLADHRPASLFAPAVVSDRTDGKIVHLDGLNLSRAWCWREIAATLPPGEARSAASEAAQAHLAASLPHVAGDYMGEHWLASFALLALTAAE